MFRSPCRLPRIVLLAGLTALGACGFGKPMALPLSTPPEIGAFGTGTFDDDSGAGGGGGGSSIADETMSVIDFVFVPVSEFTGFVSISVFVSVLEDVAGPFKRNESK